MPHIGAVGQTVWRWFKTGIPHRPLNSILGGLTCTPGYLRAVQESGDRLRGSGVQVPSWEALAAGLRPEDVDMEPEPKPKHGWQKFASVTIQNVLRETVVCSLSPAKQAMVRPVTKWPPRFGPIHHDAHEPCHANRFGLVSCSLVASLPLSLALLCSLLPVWPSPRRPWPPPRSLQHRRSIGQKGIRG